MRAPIARMLSLGGTDDPVPPGRTARRMDAGRRIGIALRHAIYRCRITGTERVPDGPLLVVANHSAFVDGALLFGILRRRVSFLVKQEANHGITGFLLINSGQYAITREAPERQVLLASLAQLRDGGCVGIFPEGTRGAGNVEQVFAGAGWLAARSDAAVLPIALRGTARPDGSRRRWRPRVDILVGEPFTVAHGAGRTIVAGATETIRQRLAELVRDLDTRLAASA